MYKLLDWIDKSRLDWPSLSRNPNAIELLEANYDKIDWVHYQEILMQFIY